MKAYPARDGRRRRPRPRAPVGVAAADPVNIGIILGSTGPLESITPDMGASAELALKEAATGQAPRRHHPDPVRADFDLHRRRRRDHGGDASSSPSENVAAIVGADCSGVTTAIANNVAIPNGVVMISPSATSPALSTIKDDGYFFRTAPSDARQGEILAAGGEGAGPRQPSR